MRSRIEIRSSSIIPSLYVSELDVTREATIQETSTCQSDGWEKPVLASVNCERVIVTSRARLDAARPITARHAQERETYSEIP